MNPIAQAIRFDVCFQEFEGLWLGFERMYDGPFERRITAEEPMIRADVNHDIAFAKRCERHIVDAEMEGFAEHLIGPAAAAKCQMGSTILDIQEVFRKSPLKRQL
jgi:hypothetical protein